MKYRIRVLVIIIFLLFNGAFCLAQLDSTRIRNVISFTPSKVNRINGLAIGLSNKPQFHKQSINGLNFELVGSGWLTPLLGLDDGGYIEKAMDKQIINGLSVGFTLMNGNINGVSLATLINTTNSFSGVKISLINYNMNISTGLELGLVNLTNKTQGAQIGLININRISRGISLGLYNCSFSDVHGLQVGIINRTRTLKGVQIGLVNINKSRTMVLFNWPSK